MPKQAKNLKKKITYTLVLGTHIFITMSNYSISTFRYLKIERQY